MERREMVTLAVTMIAIVVLPGLANAVLVSLGYETLGSAVWAVGYGSGAIFVWYVWVRPLDISAPGSIETDEE